MSLLLVDRTTIGERRLVATTGLAPLTASLSADLRPVIEARPRVPEGKARLSRAGGRCPDDGAALDFDPFSPDDHRCPRCGRRFAGVDNHRAWLMWYQLWLAERAVHAALLDLLAGSPGCAGFADRILLECAEHYLGYPNRDNVLGPSRPFFSTYLESIWLLQIAIALDLREASGTLPPSLSAAVRARVVEPSRALIASYDEGGSNRQVWNCAALLAASRLLGDDAGARRAVEGPSGLLAQLGTGLLADGTWYEGDNYHQFAHRGLWYGVTIADRAGFAIPDGLRARFDAGFRAPFVTALPDLTFPSRRDSQYAVSLRQWRFAEMAELGLAGGREDEELLGALHELYDGSAPRGDTGRWRSAAESERNEPASALTRADLGWRSLLFARESLPPLPPPARRSVLLPEQGLAILRRDGGRVYAALDYGRSGGGHGHPDRLNVLLVDGATRWLDDPGTGSYVDPSLHWYRSTMAHDAPLVDGRSQARTDGVLRAFEERGGVGWTDAEAAIAEGVVARRALVAMPDYLIDELTWRADRDVTVDLPIHSDGELRCGGVWSPAALDGGDGLEDGFAFLSSSECATGGDVEARLEARHGDDEATVWIRSDGAVQWWRAVAPAAPGRGSARFHLARMRGTTGRIVTVWSLRSAVRSVTFERSRTVVRLADGARHEHDRADTGWRVALLAGGASSAIDLGGVVYHRAAAIDSAASRGRGRLDALALRSGAAPLEFFLAGDHYRQSEDAWEEAGRPEARVAVSVAGGELRVTVSVAHSALLFAAPDARNEMDNEHPDVNGDGIQLHLSLEGRDFAWRLVPEVGDTRVRVGEVRGLGGGPAVAARWRPAGAGYVVQCALPLPHEAARGAVPFALDVLVNETAAGRERRRGQLAMSGGRGEFVYLRGDRQAMDNALTFLVVPEPDAADA